MGNGAIFTLRFVAWLNLILGCIGALIIYAAFGTIEKTFSHGFGKYTEANPVGIAIAIAVLAQGIIGCVFLLVFSSIAQNLITIREDVGKITKRFTEKF